MLAKYKPIYVVNISGQVIGYISSIDEFNELINSKIINTIEKNVDSISLKDTPSFELKLVSRSVATNENEIIEKIKENNISILYKYYAVLLNDKTEAYVDTLEDAQLLVSDIKNEYGDELNLNLQILEKYTEIAEEVKSDPIEVAEETIHVEAENIKIEKEKEEAIPTINGIKLAVTPVSGIITSRYGSISSVRSSAHTGLDIACSKGTDIQVVASGTVIFAQNNGSYGNLVKVDHGNGVETWYAHCNDIYVEVGEDVTAGDVIAAVGSTGNSTGPHLHLEIRVNGVTINPQNYLFN